MDVLEKRRERIQEIGTNAIAGLVQRRLRRACAFFLMEGSEADTSQALHEALGYAEGADTETRRQAYEMAFHITVGNAYRLMERGAPRDFNLTSAYFTLAAAYADKVGRPLEDMFSDESLRYGWERIKDIGAGI